jgi:hypothetical protein
LAGKQESHLRQHGRYSEKSTWLGFHPRLKNRFSYYLAETGPLERRTKGAGNVITDCAIIGADQVAHPKARTPESASATGCPITFPEDVSSVGVTRDAAAKPVFVALAAAVIDGQPLDCWSLSSAPRTSREGRAIAAGEPFHETTTEPPDEARAMVSTDALLRILAGNLEIWATHGPKRLPDALEEIRPELERYHAPLRWQEGVPLDGWGRPIAYRRNHDGVTLTSAGPDGRLWSRDDLELRVANDGMITEP